MLNFVIKDFRLLKRVKLIALIYPIIISIAGLKMAVMPGALYVISNIMIVYILVLYSDGYDCKNKSEVVLNSLPINRGDIVIGKYLILIVYALIGGCIAVVFSNVLKLAGFDAVCRTANIMDIAVSFIILGLLFSFYYPCRFKFGYEKMRFFSSMMFLLVFALPTLFCKFIQTSSGEELYFKLQHANLNLNIVVLLISVVILIFYLLSMLISMKIYNNKEF